MSGDKSLQDFRGARRVGRHHGLRPELAVLRPSPGAAMVPPAASPGLVGFWELLGLLLVVAGYIISYQDTSFADFHVMNVAGPLALMGILLSGAWRQVARDPRSIWQPLFWFRVASSAYYGFGALVPYIANDTTLLFMRTLYAFSEEETLKVGLINAGGILIVLATAAVVSHLRSGTQVGSVKPLAAPASMTLLFATAFLTLGGVARYVLVIPFSLGLIEVVPGIVITLAKSYAVGLYLLILAGLRGNRLALLLSWILVPLDLGIGLLTFAKTEVLTTLLFAYLGVLHHKLTIPRAALGLALVLGVYSQLDPIIHFGRDELWRRHRKLTGTLAERVEILGQYTGTQWEGTRRAEVQLALSRLSYVNAAAMIVSWRDGGRPGDSLDYLLTVLVPRAIWPDKPVITSVGTDLYLEATANVGSSISAGLFAEAYWNFGWLGLPLLMGPLGAILAVLSRYTIGVMRREAWLHLPAVLLGVLIGTRVDGWYVADVIGASATAFAVAMAAFALERVLRRPGVVRR